MRPFRREQDANRTEIGRKQDAKKAAKSLTNLAEFCWRHYSMAAFSASHSKYKFVFPNFSGKEQGLTDYPSYNEKELLRQLIAGSEGAFSTLFHRYRGKLYHYILNITGSKETAEDMVHDVFLKLWEGRANLTEVDNLGSYIYRMCRNQAISSYRRMAKETLIVAQLRQENYEVQNVDPTKAKEIKRFIQQAVDKLTPQQRKIYLLSKDQGMKHADIASQLGISINTVRAHLAEATGVLRKEISRSYGPLATAIYIVYQLS